MYQWTPRKLKFIAMNGNISDSALAGLLGTTKASVQGQRYKLGIKNTMGQRAKNYGIPGLKFCMSNAIFTVRVNKKFIGSSARLEKAVDILDNYLMGEL